LRAGSICIDAGSEQYGPPNTEFDIEGQPRVADGDCDGVKTVDMGAYEFSECVWGDVNRDGRVDMEDLAILAGDWMQGV
jgi:hypothetical protein